MLTPQQILDIIETLYPQIDELNVWITSDLIRRVMARLGRGEGVFLTNGSLRFIRPQAAIWTLYSRKSSAGQRQRMQRSSASSRTPVSKPLPTTAISMLNTGLRALSLHSLRA